MIDEWLHDESTMGVPMRLHDRRDEVRQLLVPGLDPWMLIDEEPLPKGVTIKHQEHDAIRH